jgi:fatty acid desaturase
VRPTAGPERREADDPLRIGENEAVNDYQFFNPHQPQTLQSAVILSYIDAVLGLLGFNPISFVLSVALVGGAFGIANEKKWGYATAVAAAVIQIMFLLLVFGAGVFSNLSGLLAFLFDAALVALLLHPMSRDYQRIWFK